MGAYALENSMFTVGITLFFGVLGYFFKKVNVPAAPMVLALVLGAITETNLRQALIIDDNNFFAVISRPISAVIIVIAILLAFGTPIKAWISRPVSYTPLGLSRGTENKTPGNAGEKRENQAGRRHEKD